MAATGWFETVAEAQRIEQLAKRHDARIAINYTRRWDPALVAQLHAGLKSALDNLWTAYTASS